MECQDRIANVTRIHENVWEIKRAYRKFQIDQIWDSFDELQQSKSETAQEPE